VEKRGSGAAEQAREPGGRFELRNNWSCTEECWCKARRGTGKTHTIGNLIGHLLAQGKSVLVTSQQQGALRMVRHHIVPEVAAAVREFAGKRSGSRSAIGERGRFYCGTDFRAAPTRAP